MKKVLIIGSKGQLAHDLIKAFSSNYQLIKATKEQFDITDPAATTKFIAHHSPDVIINTAAFHKTDSCELHPQKSFQVNAVGAYNVSLAAKLVNAQIIFISTDYIFDGSKKSFTEKDLPNPLNIYGASKIAGEHLTKIANPKYFIIRTSWLYGTHKSGKGHDFVSLMLEKAQHKEKIKVVNDQYGSPTNTHDLAIKIKELVEKKAPSNIYHLSGIGSTTWYHFAKEIFRLKNLKIDLTPVDSSAFPQIFNRPQSSYLRSRNLAKLKIKPLPHWRHSLKQFLLEND